MKKLRFKRPGSRRVPFGPPEPNETPVECAVCGRSTLGMPADALTLGPRSANFVSDGMIWVCSEDHCLEAWNDALDADDAERAARRAGLATEGEQPQDGPMSDPKFSDLQHDAMAFLGLGARSAFDNIWRDSRSLYGLARNLAERTLWAAGGAFVGSVTGFLIGPMKPQGRQQSEVDRLMAQVKYAQAARDFMPMATNFLTSTEYQARKKLEEMGYLPCEACGVPHVKAERHHMPPGTYWSERENAYIRPDDERWSREEYERAADERWDLDEEETVH